MSLKTSLGNGLSKIGDFAKSLGKGTGTVGAIVTTAGYLISALNPLVATIGLPTLAFGVTSRLGGTIVDQLGKALS